MNLKEMIKALKEICQWAEWEREVIESFHAYSHMFDFSPGSNVLRNVLRDALAYRGMTVQQFNKKRQVPRGA